MPDFMEQFGLDRLYNQQSSSSSEYNASPSQTPEPNPLDPFNAGIDATIGSMGLEPSARGEMNQRLQALIQAKAQKDYVAKQQLLGATGSADAPAKTNATPPKTNNKTKPTGSGNSLPGELTAEELLMRTREPKSDEYWANYYNNISTLSTEGFGPGSISEGTAPVQMWASDKSEEDIRETLKTKFGDAVTLSSMVVGPDGKPILNVEVADGATFLNAKEETLDSGEAILPKSNVLFKIKTDPEALAQMSSAFPEYEFARQKTDKEQAFLEKNLQLQKQTKKLEQGRVDRLELAQKALDVSPNVAMRMEDQGWGKAAMNKVSTLTKEITELETGLTANEKASEGLVTDSPASGYVIFKGKKVPASYIENILQNMMKDDSDNEKILKRKKAEKKALTNASSNVGITQEWQETLSREKDDLAKIHSTLRDIKAEELSMVNNHYMLPEKTRREMAVPYNNSINEVGQIIENDSQLETYKATVADLKKQMGIAKDDSDISVFLRGMGYAEGSNPMDRDSIQAALYATLWQGKSITTELLNGTVSYLRSDKRADLKALRKMINSGVGMNPTQSEEDEEGNVVITPSLFEAKLNGMVSEMPEKDREFAKKNILFAISPQAAPIVAAWKFNEMSPEDKTSAIEKAMQAGKKSLAMKQILNTTALGKFYGWNTTSNSILDDLKNKITSTYR